MTFGPAFSPESVGSLGLFFGLSIGSSIWIIRCPTSSTADQYVGWAHRLFESAPTTAPQLRFDVRFWCTPWGPASPGIWSEFGSCPLAFIEYLLIGVASLLFPNDLLNKEGFNRRSAECDQPQP